MTYSQEQYDALLAVCRSYKQEVERLKAENETYCKQITQAYDTGYDDGYDSCQDDIKQAKTECTLLDDELRNARQETINVLNKLKAKTYVNDYCREVVEVEKIDELIKELIKNDATRND